MSFSQITYFRRNQIQTVLTVLKGVTQKGLFPSISKHIENFDKKKNSLITKIVRTLKRGKKS